MIILRIDYHPEFQQIALLDKNTGEFQEKRLSHPEEAEQFYRVLVAAGQKVRVGMEASGHARWFEQLLAELQFEVRIGDAAQIHWRLLALPLRNDRGAQCGFRETFMAAQPTPAPHRPERGEVFCSDPECRYCADLRKLQEQIRTSNQPESAKKPPRPET